MSGSYGSYVDNGSFTNSSYEPGSLTNTGTNSSSNLINGLAKVGGAGISIAGNLIGANQAMHKGWGESGCVMQIKQFLYCNVVRK